MQQPGDLRGLVESLHGVAVQVAGLSATLEATTEAVREARSDIREIRDTLSAQPDALREAWKKDLADYVRKVEFEPVRNVVFGMVGTILLAVLTAWVAFSMGGRPVS